MIPKIIHYCWFGEKEKPTAIKHTINSWKKTLIDYEFIEWNENNFDINYCDFTKEAYEKKKYAFVSDVARLYALMHIGGIYLDTDVEILKPFDDLLYRDYILGKEYSGVIETSTIGASVNNPIIINFLHTYEKRSFIKKDGSLDTTPNVVHFTEYINRNYPDLEIFDQYYFSPKHPATKVCKVKNYTYCIHHFSGSWLSSKQLKRREIEGKKIIKRNIRNSVIGFFIDVEKIKRIYNFFKNGE